MARRGRVIALLASLAGACSGGDDDASGGADAAAPDASASCLAHGSIGALGDLAGAQATRTNQPGSMGARKTWRVGAFINDEEPPDQILVELWDGFGAFDGGSVAAGTFEIAGPETEVRTCGVCVYLLADIVLAQPTQSYLAQSGTVVIEQLLPELVGSIEGLTFQELDETEELVAGGCTSAMESASFAAPVDCADTGDCTE